MVLPPDLVSIAFTYESSDADFDHFECSLDSSADVELLPPVLMTVHLIPACPQVNTHSMSEL